MASDGATAPQRAEEQLAAFFVQDGDDFVPRRVAQGPWGESHWGTSGLQFINADYTLTLSRLPEGPFIGLAALTHYSHGGVATGVATLLDHQGPIGSAVATALVDPGFTRPSGA